MADNATRTHLPLYATASRRSPVIILAVDAEEIGRIDDHVRPYVEKNLNVVVLVGDRFNADPYLPGMELPETAGHISAQPAWAWCADNLPYARDVVFIP